MASGYGKERDRGGAISMQTFHFLRPEWLWGFLPLAGLLILLSGIKSTAQLWESICDTHLLPHVLVGTQETKSHSPIILLGLGWTLALVALAGPVWSQLPQPVFRAESALVIVLDVSRSMDAQDVAPSRLTRAKHKILDILQDREEGQTALVIFGGESFVVSPLTDDARTMKTLVQSLETDLMPVQGSRPDLALQRGNALLEQAGIPGGDLLLITDGEAEPTTIEMMKHLARKGRHISILGVGTEDGAPIPEQGGFVKDESGAIVVQKLNPNSLESAARMAGGRYSTVSLDDRDLEKVLPSVDGSRLSTQSNSHERTTNIWREEGPWLAVVLLVVVLPAFRRGWVGVVLLCLLFPQISQAFSWDNIWERSDQQAMKAFEQQDPKKAARLFEQSDWKGIAHYRAGDFEQAEQILSGLDSPEGQYNRGNALAKLGKYPEAIASYQAALTKQPDHEDAKHNLDLLKKMLEDQQSPSSQENDSQSSNSSSEDQQQKGDGKESKQPGQEQESQKSDQDKKSSEAASNPEKNETEKGTSESSQDSSNNAKQSENPKSQNPSQEPEDKTDSSDLTQSSPGDDEKEANAQEKQAAATQSEEARQDQKSEQALQQWLRRIPDDPGGLLRRKFLLEHRRRVEAGTAVDSSGRSW